MRSTTRLSAALLATLLVATPTTAQDATPRPMTVDDALDMVSVGSPLLSPDGSWILYSHRTLNWDDNEYETEYWAAPTDGSDAYRYIGEEGGSGFQFSPNGTWLTFRRPVGEGASRRQQVFGMRTSGARPSS